MVPQILPASAAAFAPRATFVNVVMGSKVELWLTQVLKSVIRTRRPLNSVAKHQRCLTELLSSETAVWTLTSLMASKVPDFELHSDSNPLKEALLNYRNYHIIHLEAYIVHVDMVLQNEVAFKLTSQSIEALTDYHDHVYSVNLCANLSPWPEMDAQLKQLREDFIHSINKFVYRTHISVLEGLCEDGAGELLSEKSEQVKNNIMNLFRPLKPPRKIETKCPQPICSSYFINSSCWPQPSYYTGVSDMQEIEGFISSSSETISSTNSSFLRSSMGLNNIEEPSLISPFSPPYMADKLLCTSIQAGYSVPEFLNTHISVPEHPSDVNGEYGVHFWDQC